MENSKLDEIFDEYSSTPDLARRLDAFMKSQNDLGKPVHVRSYYNGIKRAIKKVFIKTLQFTNIEESPRCAILETLLRVISDIVDFSPEGQDSFKSFVPTGINLVMDKTKTFQIRTETIKFLNGVVESYGRCGGLSDPIERLPFFQNFESILTWAGDIELQLSMTEFIFRMLSREERHTLATNWFECYPEVGDNFFSIRDEEFEQDCRKFINSLNEKQPENRSVYSLRCQAVYLGTFKVNGPIDDGCDGFWTDFNIGSQSLSFFACEEEDDNSWETVVIKCEYVTEIKLLDKKEDGLIAVILNLNTCVHTLLQACPKTSENYVKLLYGVDNSPVEAANHLFTIDVVCNHSSLSPDVVACTPPKASVAINAVHISSRSKGYTKTVPMLTPMRKKKDCVSSEDAKISADGSKASEMDIEGKRDKHDASGQSANEEDNTRKTDRRNVLEKIDKRADVLVENVEEDGNAMDSEDTKDKSGELGNAVDSGIQFDSDVDVTEVRDRMEENKDRKDEEVIDDGECVAEDDVNNGDTKEQTENEWGHEDGLSIGGDTRGSELDGDREESDNNRKTKRGKAAKGRVRRSKPLPKNGEAIANTIQCTEYSARDMKKRGKKVQSDKGIGTRTRSRSKGTDAKKTYGSGYNTEDWSFGNEEKDREQEKQTFERTVNKGSKELSQARLSLIKNVFRDTDDERSNTKSCNPFEFKYNNDATGKEAISGLGVNEQDNVEAMTPNLALGDLIKECIGMPGDLLNEEDTQEKVGSSVQREIVRECTERGHREINRNIKDNGGSGQQDDVTRMTAKARGRHGIIGDSKNYEDGAGPVDKASKKSSIGKDHEGITGDGKKVAEQQDDSDKGVDIVSIISDEEDDDDDNKKKGIPVTRSSIVSKKAETSMSPSKTNNLQGANIQRHTPTERRGKDENETSEKGSSSESEDENVVRRSPILRKKKVQALIEKSTEEQDEKCHMSEDDLDVIESFKNNFAKIIGESTRRRSRSKTASPWSLKKKKTRSSGTKNETTIVKSAETLTKSKAKTSSKTSRDSRSAPEHWEDDEQTKTPESSLRGSLKKKERFNTNPFEFDARTPKIVRCAKADSGYFGRTPGSSSRKRTLDTRDETPGSSGNTRDGTPATNFKKPRRFGCLDVMSGASSSHKVYRSNEETQSSSFRQKFCSITTEGTKRKRKDEKIGFVSGPFSVHRTKQHSNPSPNPGEDKRSDISISENYVDVNGNFQTPGDEEFAPIKPRKLFQSGNWSAEVNRKKKASTETDRDEQEDEDEDKDERAMAESVYNDDVSTGDEMQLNLGSLGQDMERVVKRRNCVNQMAHSSTCIKLITKRSQQIWSRHSSKRKKLMSEYTSRVDKYIKEQQDVSATITELENNMLIKHLEILSTQRKENENSLQNIIKTQKAFIEAFKCLEEDTECEQEDLQSSLRKEMLQYRDEVIKEVQKQEIENIKRRIQAFYMLVSDP